MFAAIAPGLLGFGTTPTEEPTPTTLCGSTCFYQGVASGDPTDDSIVLWTRVDPCCVEKYGDHIEYTLIPKESAQGGRRLHNGDASRTGHAKIEPGRDYTVHAEPTGLHGSYSYYFSIPGSTYTSEVGHTRTAHELDSLKIAHTSCSNFPHGYFTVYHEMARMLKSGELDAWTHVGDFIYEYGHGGYGMGAWNITARDGNDQTDGGLLAVRAAGVNVGQVWDDHEIANDMWGDGAENHDDEEDGISWAARKANGLEAWLDYMPVRGTTVGYRASHFGAAEVVSMNTRWGSENIDIGEPQYEEALWSLHDPALWKGEDGEYSSPWTDPARAGGVAVARAQMLAILESRQAFSEEQLQWILNKIGGSSAANVILLSGTQALSNMWNYGDITLAGTSFEPLLKMVATGTPDFRSVLYGTAGKGTTDILFAILYGLYRGSDTLAQAQGQLQQLISACDARPNGGKCTILSGDVHNGYITQHSERVAELTSPSVSAIGLVQNFVTSLPNGFADIPGAIASSTGFDMLNMLQSREAGDLASALANSQALGGALYSGDPATIGSTWGEIAAAAPYPKVVAQDVAHNGFGVTHCTAAGCSYTIRGLPIGCLSTPTPIEAIGCVFNDVHTV